MSMRGRQNLSRTYDGNSRRAAALILAALLAAWSLPGASTKPEKTAPGISKAASKRCDTKLKSIEKFGASEDPSSGRTTQFTQEEVNSYLALELSPKFHPCLKTLQMTFEERNLGGIALLDFDKLRASSTKVMPRILSLILSGTHTLNARGRLLSGNGQANFKLDEAHFDDSSLPNSLVEQIITAVCKRQNPPFDPLQPSKLPYRIEKVEVHQGYVTVYQ